MRFTYTWIINYQEAFRLHGFDITQRFYITRRFYTINRLIDGINRVMNGITRLINRLTRLINGWGGPGRGPWAPAGPPGIK